MATPVPHGGCRTCWVRSREGRDGACRSAISLGCCEDEGEGEGEKRELDWRGTTIITHAHLYKVYRL